MTSFAGVWRGCHHGETYLVVDIPQPPAATGSLLGQGVEFGDDGAIRRIRKGESVQYGVMIVQQRPGMLLLRYKTEEGRSLEFEMQLVSAGRAVLRVVGAPAKIHPFQLKRDKSEKY